MQVPSLFFWIYGSHFSLPGPVFKPISICRSLKIPTKKLFRYTGPVHGRGKTYFVMQVPKFLGIYGSGFSSIDWRGPGHRTAIFACLRVRPLKFRSGPSATNAILYFSSFTAFFRSLTVEYCPKMIFTNKFQGPDPQASKNRRSVTRPPPVNARWEGKIEYR